MRLHELLSVLILIGALTNVALAEATTIGETSLPLGSDAFADLDEDGDVDTNDLLDMLGAWGDCDEPDCTVNVSDLLVLSGEWG